MKPLPTAILLVITVIFPFRALTSPNFTPSPWLESPPPPTNRNESADLHSVDRLLETRASERVNGKWARASVPALIYADTSTCRGDRLRAVEAAIEGVAILAQAGLNALSPDLIGLEGNPARYFFRDDSVPYVRTRLQSAVDYVTGHPTIAQKGRIRVTCKDDLIHFRTNQCKLKWNSDDGGFLGKAAFVWSWRPKSIVLCDYFFLFSARQVPCTGKLSMDGLTGIGASSQAGTLLHEVMHGISSMRIGDGAYGTRDCHELLRNDPLPSERSTIREAFALSKARGKVPESNADSYAWMSEWAHVLGLGSVDPGATRCLDWFKPGRKLIGPFDKLKPGESQAGHDPRVYDLVAKVWPYVGWKARLAYCRFHGLGWRACRDRSKALAQGQGADQSRGDES